MAWTGDDTLKAGIGGGFGLMDIGLNLFNQSEQQNMAMRQYREQAAANQQQNARQALMIKEANARTREIYGYQTNRFKQNLGFIQEEYSRAGEDLQRELGAAFAQSAYSRQNQLGALANAVGYNNAAFEGASRSRQRADLLGTLGTFGRNQAMEAERLSGVVAQTNRNRQALGRQATQSIFNAFGDLGITPELQKFYAQAAPTPPMQSGLGIANAISSGLQSAVSTASSLGLGS